MIKKQSETHIINVDYLGADEKEREVIVFLEIDHFGNTYAISEYANSDKIKFGGMSDDASKDIAMADAIKEAVEFARKAIQGYQKENETE